MRILHQWCQNRSLFLSLFSTSIAQIIIHQPLTMRSKSKTLEKKEFCFCSAGRVFSIMKANYISIIFSIQHAHVPTSILLVSLIPKLIFASPSPLTLFSFSRSMMGSHSPRPASLSPSDNTLHHHHSLASKPKKFAPLTHT